MKQPTAEYLAANSRIITEEDRIMERNRKIRILFIIVIAAASVTALFLIFVINPLMKKEKSQIVKVVDANEIEHYFDIRTSEPEEVPAPAEEPTGRTLEVRLAEIENGVLKLNGPPEAEHSEMVEAAREIFIKMKIIKRDKLSLFTETTRGPLDEGTFIILSRQN